MYYMQIFRRSLRHTVDSIFQICSEHDFKTTRRRSGEDIDVKRRRAQLEKQIKQLVEGKKDSWMKFYDG